MEKLVASQTLQVVPDALKPSLPRTVKYLTLAYAKSLLPSVPFSPHMIDGAGMFAFRANLARGPLGGVCAT